MKSPAMHPPFVDSVSLPAWVNDAADAGATLASTTIEDAVALDAATLREAVADAYRKLFITIDDGPASHAVRAWNFVPDILAPMADGGDRYMSFNAGRFDAMVERFGPRRLAECVPSGTGVGHAGDDLTIHLLATRTPGVAVDNPLQTPAYRYSPRYGPMPPCFARATRAVLPTGARLLVAGTAAIRGETTLHEHDFAAQLRLTIDNLRAVLKNDCATGAGEGDVLDRFQSLRAYAPPMADVVAVRRSLPQCEIVRVAALCRPDLLIEIEGVATTPDAEKETR